MRKKRQSLLHYLGGLLLLLAGAAPAAIGATWYVTENGNDENDGRSWHTALATPQTALDKASSGDSIYIGPGTFHATHIIKTDSEFIYTASFVIKEGVSIYGGFTPELDRRVNSGHAWSFESETVLTIPETYPGSVIVTSTPPSQKTVIDGIIIRGGMAIGSGPSGNGGGANITGNVLLRNCLITENTARNGGGLFIGDGASAVNCKITGNGVFDDGWGGNGGGVYAEGDISISNCLITENGAGARRGGGIYGSGPVSVDFCTITGNESVREGSGACLHGTDSSITSSVIWGNSGASEQACLHGNAENCAVEGAGINGKCVRLMHRNCGEHGISGNDNHVGEYYPCFVSPENGDWRLAPGSYLINRGLETIQETDASGNARKLCGISDIGAFESPHRGNLAADFEISMPCIYGGTSSAAAIPGALTPDDVIITFEDGVQLAEWSNDGGVWCVSWMTAGNTCPVMHVVPSNRSEWTSLTLMRELAVSPRPIFIMADDMEYTYPETQPEMTWSIIAGSLAQGDSITGYPECLTTGVLETSWKISRGTIAIDDGANGINYSLTFLDGEMICHKAEAEIVLVSNTLPYTSEKNAPAVTTFPAGLEYNCQFKSENGERLIEIPADAGKYTVEITVTDPYYCGTLSTGYTIEKAILTATAKNAARQYQTDNPSFEVSITGLLDNDSMDEIILPTAATTAAPDSSAGSYPIILSGGTARNYDFEYKHATLTVTPAEVKATVNDSSITYGDSISEAPIYGTAVHASNNSPVPGTFSWKAPETLPEAGNIEAAWHFVPQDAANYLAASGTAEINIGKKEISVRADNITVQYGEPDHPLTYSVDGLNINSSASGALKRNKGTDVGTYEITVGDLDFGNNYQIAFTEGTYTIAPREVHITIENAGKEYGGRDPELRYSITGGSLVGDSTITGFPSRAPGEEIGTYPITAGSLGISDANNYAVTIHTGTFTISRSSKPGLAENIETDPIQYGDTLENISISGTMLTPDGSKVIYGTFQWKYPEMRPDAGTQMLEWIFTPDDQERFSTFSGEVEITVEKAVLTVDIHASSPMRYYKEPNPEYTFTYSGFLPGDDERCIKTEPYIATDANYDSQPGTYKVGITGGESDNYVFQAEPIKLTILGRKISASSESEIECTPIVYGDKLDASEASGYIIDENTGDVITGTFIWKSSDSILVPGTATVQCTFIPASPCYTGGTVTVAVEVEKYTLKITSLPASKEYQETDPVIEWICIDERSDLAEGAELEITIAREDGEDAGDYRTFMTAWKENPCFDFIFEEGVFTIHPKPLAVTANDTFKFYRNNDPELTCTVTDPLPDGIYIEGSPAREPGEEIGTYSISTGNLTLNSKNYYIDLTPGTFTIYKRPLSIELKTPWKYYDRTPETLEYTVINTLEGSDVTLVGNLTRKAGENTGTYLVDTSGLTPTDPEHFCVSPNNVFFQIKQRPVTIQLHDQEMTFRDPPVEYTYSIVDGSLLDGDKITGTPSASAVLGQNQITGRSMKINSNYILKVLPGTLTVYTDIPYLVFEGIDGELTAYDSAKDISFKASAYREHFNTPVEGTFELSTTNNKLNAGMETAILEFTFQRRLASNLDSKYSYTTSDTVTFYVNKLRMSIETGDYEMTYGDEPPEITPVVTNCASSSIASPEKLLSGDFLEFDTDFNDIGVFPINYNAAKMTNSNLELSVVTGKLTIKPRMLLVKADSGYATTADTPALDYQVNKVLNSTSVNCNLEEEKKNAPELILEWDESQTTGAHKISFSEYTAENYAEYDKRFGFLYEQGILIIYDTEEETVESINRQTLREEYSSSQQLNSSGFDVAFVSSDTYITGKNVFRTLEQAYKNVNAGGIICIEPGTYMPEKGMFSIDKPLTITGIKDQNGMLPEINGTVKLLSNSKYSDISWLSINSPSGEYAVIIDGVELYADISGCVLTSDIGGIIHADDNDIIRACTIDAPIEITIK